MRSDASRFQNEKHSSAGIQRRACPTEATTNSTGPRRRSSRMSSCSSQRVRREPRTTSSFQRRSSGSWVMMRDMMFQLWRRKEYVSRQPNIPFGVRMASRRRIVRLTAVHLPSLEGRGHNSYPITFANRLPASSRSSFKECTYLCVVARCLCPAIFCTTCTGTPARNQAVIA